MIFQQKLNTEDILAFRKNVRETSRQMKNRYLLVGSISAIIYFLYILYKTYNVPDVYFIELFPTYSKWGFYIFHLASFIFIIYPTLVELSYYQSGSPVFIKRSNVLNEREVNVDHLGISIESKGDTNTYKWENILRVSEDDLRYFLYITDTKAIIINIETINLTEEQQTLLKQLIREHTNLSSSIDKTENMKRTGVWSFKTRLMLVFLYILITGISSQDWGVTLKEATQGSRKTFC
ncbi:YcxB family protein [Robertmurraya korlensis]|uniref:YcxB family protein n=1 Tax=Robertmurraya korlensis TaxID=519977 RepID=UPI000826BE22|nr:YcxB family protein [Robertmurraya korlensis]